MSSSSFLRASILVLLAFSAAWSVEYYVSPTGSDSANNGLSIGAPYKTLGKAAGKVEPGDTVWLMDGNFTSNGWTFVELTKSGTADAWISWKALPGHSPQLVMNDKQWNAIVISASYQLIEGITVTGMNDSVTLEDANIDYAASGPGSPKYNGNGITLDNSNRTTKHHSVTVRNCIVRKCCGCGISFFQSDNIRLEGNVVYENAWYMRYAGSGISLLGGTNAGTDTIGYRMVITGNKLWKNQCLVKWKKIDKFSDGNGIIIDSFNGSGYTGKFLISNNFTALNGGSGIHAYISDNVDIVNNTAWNNGQVVGYAEIYSNQSKNCRIINNIMYARDGGKVNGGVGTKEQGTVYDYNLYCNNSGTIPSKGAHDVVGNPQFVNLVADRLAVDFHLQSGSPAIDSATSISLVTPVTDIVGTVRPQGAHADRGAYEYIPPVLPQVPVISSVLTCSGAVGTALSYHITASHAPTSYSASGLPAGVSVNVSTGVISGNPSAPGTTSSAISATNADGTGTATLVFTIAADTMPPASPAAPTASSLTSATPTLSGITEANAVVAVYVDGALMATVTAGSDGTWVCTVTLALAAGTHAITATATDRDGNTSAISDATTITVAAVGSFGGIQNTSDGSSSGGCGAGSIAAVLLGAVFALVSLVRHGRVMHQGTSFPR